MSYSNPMHHSTPGPWVWGASARGAVVYQDTIGTVATVPADLCGYQANATLIAAAPDLLAALRALLPHVPGYQSGDSAGRPWLDQALAAIAKATAAKDAPC